MSPSEPYQPFELFGISITPFIVRHPPAFTAGSCLSARVPGSGLLRIPMQIFRNRALNFLKDLDLLLLDALVPSSTHVHKHMNYLDACTLAERLTPKEYRCTHISHIMPWEYPHLASDGEIFEFA